MAHPAFSIDARNRLNTLDGSRRFRTWWAAVKGSVLVDLTDHSPL